MLIAALLLQAVAPLPAPATGEVNSPARQIPMKAPRTYEGVWLDAFEAQIFYPDLRTAIADKGRRADIWLGIDRFHVLRTPANKALVGARNPGNSQLRLYRVRFVGREALDMSCGVDDGKRPFECYGHMGVFHGLIVVDRMLDIVDLGPPPWISSDSRR